MIIINLNDVEATKIRSCSTQSAPKGVEVYGSNVWVAIDAGRLQKFNTSNCSVTSYTVNGDPHFIDVQSNSKIAFTQHINNKITYYNASNNTQLDCTNNSINGADDIDSYSFNLQYFTSYNTGKVIKSVKNGNSCTITSYTLPESNSNPEGIDKSTDISGMFIVDQRNNKLYKFNVSTGQFTLCVDFKRSKPWFIAVDDSQDFLWVTFMEEKKIRAVGTLSCLVAETSTTAPNRVYDVAVIGSYGYAVVTFVDVPKVAKYDYSTDQWIVDDLSSECSNCEGFGIDTIYSSKTYYAALRSPNGSKLVVGSFT